MKSNDRDAYVVIAPTGKSKIYSVACRKIGSRDRFTVIATCQHEVTADSLVDGLKLLQGEELKLTVAADLALADVRAQLSKMRIDRDEARAKLRVQDTHVRELEMKLSDASIKLREERIKNEPKMVAS